MSLVPPRRLRWPLLGMAFLWATSPALHAFDVQHAGLPCPNGGTGAQPAADPPIKGLDATGSWEHAPSEPPPAAALLAATVPPGTLGQTYQLPSRPIPARKHPRVAMIDVCTPLATHVIVRGTNDFRTEESLAGYRDEQHPSLWHFESKPLVPGLSHIYRVEVYHGGPGSLPTQVRYVRLIMGRIVSLTI